MTQGYRPVDQHGELNKDGVPVGTGAEEINKERAAEAAKQAKADRDAAKAERAEAREAAATEATSHEDTSVGEVSEDAPVESSRQRGRGSSDVIS